jgi:hypothetical protein
MIAMDKTGWRALDFLSPVVRAVMEVNALAAYGRLVVREESTAIARELIAHLRPEELLTDPLRDAPHGRAMLAGLWLWHDGLAESHEISQALPSATGSFWHAIMHRREGDFSNAKYWYARCRHHPVNDQVAAQAQFAPSVVDAPLHQVTDGGWDPDRFVDVVVAVHRTPDDPLYAAAVSLQRLEWQALFAHCARNAAGVQGPWPDQGR